MFKNCYTAHSATAPPRTAPPRPPAPPRLHASTLHSPPPLSTLRPCETLLRSLARSNETVAARKAVEPPACCHIGCSQRLAALCSQ